MMNRALYTPLCLLILAAAGLLLLPASAFAQLPNPTYGWNLGNTFEAPCGVGCWAPAPTEALIKSVAHAGFNTVRVPCAWDVHSDKSSHQIDAKYMAQVKQLVDWCEASGLYVVLNDHWDGGWLDSKLTGTVKPDIDTKMSAYWSQIATAFADYHDHLLLAAANDPPVDNADKMSVLMAYYQTFVNTVRATGGNNTSRWLIVQGPGTDIDKTDTLMTGLPHDPTPGRMMVEVHYYAPYNFGMMDKDATWGNMSYFWGKGYHSTSQTKRNSTWGEESYVDTEFAKMQSKFAAKGIPVLLGEFGTIRRTSYSDLTGTDLKLHLASRTYWDKYIVDSAHSHGMYPIYWDDGGTNKNSFGLFDRKSAALIDTDSARALTGGPAVPAPTVGKGHKH